MRKQYLKKKAKRLLVQLTTQKRIMKVMYLLIKLYKILQLKEKFIQVKKQDEQQKDHGNIEQTLINQIGQEQIHLKQLILKLQIEKLSIEYWFLKNQLIMGMQLKMYITKELCLQVEMQQQNTLSKVQQLN